MNRDFYLEEIFLTQEDQNWKYANNDNIIEILKNDKKIKWHAVFQKLSPIMHNSESLVHARSGFVRKREDKQANYFGEHNGYVSKIKKCHKDFLNDMKIMDKLELITPEPDMSLLPKNSFFLSFKFTLKTPYISRDDEDFYIIENPIRKEKVFKVPMVAASSWKGILRWVMMKTDLEPTIEDPNEFAKRRFRHTLLFGTEKGMAEEKSKSKYLDDLCLEGKDNYQQLLRNYFSIPKDKPLPHNQGFLHFYPTYFDNIGLHLINPHTPETGTGTNPILIETVPANTSGIFSILYVPFTKTTYDEKIKDFNVIKKGVIDMMVNYGFSSKRSSGFGEAKRNFEDVKVYEAGE